MENQIAVTERQKTVLAAVVNAYIKTGCPIGSKAVAREFRFEISSATVRNEMSELEENGFITHPHISAGRVPTDKGYRYYVDSLMQVSSVEPNEAAWVAWEFRQKAGSVEDLIDRTIQILAALTEQAAWIVYPGWEMLVLKHIELIPFRQRRLVVVWTATSGFVQNKVVELPVDVSENELSRLNYFLNGELSGKYFSEIPKYLNSRLAEANDAVLSLYRAARLVAERVFGGLDERRFVLHGARHIFRQPEFRDQNKTRLLARLLERTNTLRELFMEPVSSGQVRVKIGRENHPEETWDFSTVMAPYHFQDQSLGTLGILGPTRMPYARVIALVDCVARRLTNGIEALV